MKFPGFHRRLRLHFKTISAFIIVIISLYYFFTLRGTQNLVQPQYIYDELVQSNESSPKSYIVRTSTCNIPDFHPWDSSVELLSTKCEPSDEVDPKCHDRNNVRRWMYSTASELVVNNSAILSSGYSWNTIRCCYHVIERVEQSLDNYDMNADSVIRYSKECYPIQHNQQIITDEFIRVYCIATIVPLFEDVVYREHFAFPQLEKQAILKIPNSKENSQTLEAISNSPPNIVIIGIDTNSRLNSRRRFKKTLQVLKEMGAIEMFGYTKVGENTFPNTVAFLTGMDTKEMQPICFHSDDDPQDDCPYVWKDFKNAGYLTATVEDVPYATGFNYLKTGFIRKPCDFYLRPLLLGIMMQPREHVWFAKCVGRYYIEELLLKYIRDILEVGSKSITPVFIHSWFTLMTHHCINSARFRDELISNFLETVNMTNTLLIFMSDHGDRYGKFRETTLGWYEDKLPTMWIHLPLSLREKFPEWDQSLRINSRRLSSHFDLYHTFTHILKTFRSNVPLQESFTPNAHRKGQSFFHPIPENRTCDQAGIPSAYCACTEPETLKIDSDNKTGQAVLLNAAEAAINFLAQSLPKECAKPVLKEIVSGKIMRIAGGSSGAAVYIVSMYTDPGSFLFEVTLRADAAGRFVIETLDDLLRMNKMNRKVNCLSSPVLERYCYCI